jgi:hypothetical protein
MKSWKVIRIFSITIILTLLLTTLAVLPTSATDYTATVTLSPNAGKVGDTINVVGKYSPASYESRFASFYLSPTNIAIGANISTSSLYYTKVKNNITILTNDNGAIAGNTSPTTFTIPSVIPVSSDPLAGGTVSYTVTGGTYYVYMTITSSLTPNSEWIVAAKATLTVTAPALDALQPSTGLAGQDVVVSGANFPANTTLVFKFDTTTLTPTSGHTATTAGGLFLTHITIPSSATAGVHTISVTVGTVTLSASFTVTGGATTTTTTPASNALIDLSVTSGPAGSSVTVTGVYFPASTDLFFKFDSTTIVPTSGDTATGSAGFFVTVITIPSTAAAGVHTISAIAGSSSASASFAVTTTTTTPTSTVGVLTLSETSGPTGMSISVAGSGFTPSHAFTVYYAMGDGTSTNVTGTIGTNGFLMATLEIPSSSHGVHTITATDGTHTATADFTVESSTPDVPQPLRPYMDEAVSSPVTFDWADSADVSVPVTYRFQIATDATFTTDSIMINKTDIATSTYTLTDADLAKLSVGATYYWREKAVDGAMNESSWTGANRFSLSQPFSFTGWPLWVTIGIGAVLLFLLGIWLGRRTAYNY